MANFELRLVDLLHGGAVTADDLRYLAECIAKCSNLTDGSSHELDGTLKISGADAEIRLLEGVLLHADGGGITVRGSTASLIANLSALVSLEVVGEYAKIYFGPDKLPTLSSRSLDRQFSGDWIPGVTGDGWTYDSDVFRWRATDTTQRLLARRTRVRPGTLSEVSVTIQGANHGAWPPGTMPKINVYKINSYGGTVTWLGTKEDDAAKGVYATAHEIVLDGLEEEFSNEQYELGVVFYSETGDNAVAGTLVIGARYQMAYADLRPG